MNSDYVMESPDEAYRLDIKTDPEGIEDLALWAGIRPGMRVLDVGCGAGKTTAVLHRLVQPQGHALGIDASPERVAYAREHYGSDGPTYHRLDARDDLTSLGSFDLVWIRFLLQFHRLESSAILDNVLKVTRPGGIITLIDLDRVTFQGLCERLEKTIAQVVQILYEKGWYDPIAGTRLSSALKALGCTEIEEVVVPYHQIRGEATETDLYNWMRKVTVVSQKVDYQFHLYKRGVAEFLDEFHAYFHSPQLSISTPMICCRGTKPS